VPQAGGVGPGKEFFEVFPELDAAEAWLMENAPWVRGTLSFGLLTSWGSGVHGRPAFDISALERVILHPLFRPFRTASIIYITADIRCPMVS
jgi:hypothetical protein